MEFHIWGEEYEIPIRRHFLSVKPFNLKRLQEKVRVLYNVDPLDLKFIPGEGDQGTLEDALYIDKNLTSTSLNHTPN